MLRSCFGFLAIILVPALLLRAETNCTPAASGAEICVAVSETRISGTVTSGSYASTHADDGIFEVLTEQDATVGPPKKRADLLEHRWSFDLAAGGSFRFGVKAYRVDAGNDGDNFRFSYSTNGGTSWTDMVTVNAGASQSYSFTLPGSLAAAFLVRAVDANRSAGRRSHASLHVDHLYVEVAAAPPPPPPPTGKRLVGYYTSWSIYDRAYYVNEYPAGVDHIPAEKLTHVNYAFANLDASGNVIVGDAWADIEKKFGNEPAGLPFYGNFRQLLILKQSYPQLRTFISVGGWTWSDNFSNVFADAAKRQTFCASLLNFVNQYGLDGADIDWEYPGAPGEGNPYRSGGVDAANFITTMALCRPAFAAADKQLSIATSCHPNLYRHPARGGELDLAGLMPYIDMVNPMAYDMHGSWDSLTGHHSQLFLNAGDPYGADPVISKLTGSACTQGHLAEGVPAAKINLGMPFYGHAYQRVNRAAGGNPAIYGLFQPFSGVPSGTYGAAGVFEYEHLLTSLKPQGAYAYDTAAAVPTLTWNITSTNLGFVSYEDRTSACRKAQYALDNSLGGIMFWELSADIEDHAESLVRALYCRFNPAAAGCGGVCP